MKVIKTISEMKEIIRKIKKENKKIGFVPTMGYLHEGHLSLVKEAKENSDITIMSIFVNPIQFGPNEDFEKYPRDFERDEKLACNSGVDYLFYPHTGDMYGENFKTYVEVLDFTDGLCGKKRPGHFKGVTTVVLKLINIVEADVAVFGKKDAQQLRVIEKMVEDLNMNVRIIRGNIVREDDGLAMSSRNKYLSTKERLDALALRKSLILVEELVKNGERNFEIIEEVVKKFLGDNFEGVVLDYFEAVDYSNMNPIINLKGEVLIAIAAFVGKTRLIDNVIIKML